MKIAYLECFAGIAGDMFLGALVDAGVDPQLLQKAADSLHLGVVLEFKKVDRSGIQSTKARVLVNGVDADAPGTNGHHAHPREHTHTHTDEHGALHTHAHTHSHVHEHSHVHAQEEAREHRHIHGRSLSAILELVDGAAIPVNARRIARRAFERLGAAEAKIHGVPIENIQFHEVGAVDAIVDIVCGAVGADSLGVESWHCSSVNTGSGFVDCAHGRFPVPAPATLELLAGVPVYAEGPAKELTTPTGAALLQALGCVYTQLPPAVFASTGYGAGTRNPEAFPNVLRLRIGAPHTVSQPERNIGADKDTVTVLECAIDDATPEMLAFAAHAMLMHGALDVVQQPGFMKKGRMGTIFTVVARPQDAEHLERMIFRETTTLGVRIRQEQRSILERDTVHVETEYGTLRVKVGRRGTTRLNSAPEFEDCREAAERYSVSLKHVMQTVMAAYSATESAAIKSDHTIATSEPLTA